MERYFLWSDGDGHEYAVPISLKKEIDHLEKAEDEIQWFNMFEKIESKLICIEGCFTFLDPQTDCNY